MQNAGDNLLLRATLEQIYRAYPDAEVTLLINDIRPNSLPQPSIPSLANWVRAYQEHGGGWKIAGFLKLPYFIFVLLWTLFSKKMPPRLVSMGLDNAQKALLDAYLTCDIVTPVAGNYLYSSGKAGLALKLAVASIAYGAFLGKTVVMMPQTLGPFTNRFDERLMRWLINRVDHALLRDQLSFDFLKTIGAKVAHCHVVPDLAFGFGKLATGTGEALLKAYDVALDSAELKIGITLIDWGCLFPRFTGQAAYETAIEQTIRAIVANHQATVVLFSQVHGPTRCEDDRHTARRVYERLSDLSARVVFVSEALEPHALKDAYRHMDLFIGTRLHSTIFAMSEFVPTIGLAYQSKTHGAFALLDLGDWVIDLAEVRFDNLSAMVEQLIAQRDTIQAHLKQQIPELQAQHQKVVAALQEVA